MDDTTRTPGPGDDAEISTPKRVLVALLVSGFSGGLGFAVVSLSPATTGLAGEVARNIDISGVSNPVTAVLLNFRGYDTLLEMGVLLLAVLGVFSLNAHSVVSDARESGPGAVLNTVTRLLVPVLILVAGYLLWAGGHAPGGAFQAGSVLAAGGVLLLLSGWRPGFRITGLLPRAMLVAGLSGFVATGAAVISSERLFLEYPQPLAGMLILLIEAMATLSIAATLAVLFMGGLPVADEDK